MLKLKEETISTGGTLHAEQPLLVRTGEFTTITIDIIA